jgi:DHA2 family multidrug resistance protein
MAMAVFSMVIMVGPAVGPVLGGWITDGYSWPWIFFVNLPVGVLGIYLTARNVHEPEDVLGENRARAQLAKQHFDYAGLVLMGLAIGALQYVLEEGSSQDWFDSTKIVVGTYVAVVALAGFIIRELTATAPVVDLRVFRDPTFASGTFVAGIVFAMLMGSMFLLPVFTQEMLHFSATQSGVVLLPRTIAMMIASPFVGRLYNKTSPALLVGSGMVMTALGCWMQADINLMTSSDDLFWPLAITGVGFAFLFVPLTTAALSQVPRHQLAGAAGVNSFVRQVGGSIGLSLFATLFTQYGAQAQTALAAHVNVLRPELSSIDLHQAAGRVALQGVVIGFDKTFVLQTIAFLVVLPILLFLRVKRDKPAHVELAVE